MILNAKKIIGLPVETSGGTKIGKVADINLDIESHIVNSYAVRCGFISNENLIIGRNQVLSIDGQKMIVEDGAIREKIKSNTTETLMKKTEPALTATSK
jgi:sporulation protein YlmC with PRC-barrel domain